MFIIPCKYTEKSNIINCVDSIRRFYPDEKIVVVDSDSEDKSYFEYIKGTCTVLDYKNTNYVEGALWMAYHLFPDEPFYCILHDSTQLLKSLDEYIIKDLTILCAFNDGTFEYRPSWSDGPDRHRERWARNKFMECKDFEFVENILYGVFGNMFIASNKVMKELKEKNIDKIFLPTSKDELEAMERVWGMIFLQMGYNIQDLAIETEFFGTTDHFKTIKKIFANRK